VRVVIGVQQVKGAIEFVCELQLGHPVELVLGDLFAVQTVERYWRQSCLFLFDIARVIGIEIVEGLRAFDVSLVWRAAHAETLTGVEVAGTVYSDTSADSRVRVAADVARAGLANFGKCASRCAVFAVATANRVWYGDIDKGRQVCDLDASTDVVAMVATVTCRESVAARAHAMFGTGSQVPLSDECGIDCGQQSRQGCNCETHGCRSKFEVRGRSVRGVSARCCLPSLAV
jgi:hypothetical protein